MSIEDCKQLSKEISKFHLSSARATVTELKTISPLFVRYRIETIQMKSGDVGRTMQSETQTTAGSELLPLQLDFTQPHLYW